ncbi:MAG TPA: ABC transporter ATP-binding protein [Phnomibacter sp.]|nr:ABC transporter ATP-binding protein [Phnomibacter sp.]
MPADNILLQVDQVSFNLPGHFELAPVSFSLTGNEKLVIAGETGSGKSTLLKLIAGLLQPAAGSISFAHKRVEGPLEKLIPGHPGIAYLSQHYELRNNYIVYDLLDYGSEMSQAEAEQLFRVCEIDHLLQRKTNSGLSGGERQRIALAKLLATKPRLLLLDEPFSNLDSIHKSHIKQVLYNIGQAYPVSMILVSHDPQDMLSWADKIMVMRNGGVLQQASPEDIYLKPVNSYVAGLFGPFNTVSASWLVANGYPGFSEKLAKMFMLREEHIFIGDNHKQLMATPTRCVFTGPAYRVTLEAGGGTFTCLHHQPVPAGIPVAISIDTDKLWPLQEDASD